MIAQDITDIERRQADSITEIVAKITGIKAAVIQSRRRDAPIVRARWLVAVALRGTGMTYSRTGKALGLDHGTIMHACQKFHWALKLDRRFRDQAVAIAKLGWPLKGGAGVLSARGGSVFYTRASHLKKDPARIKS